MPCGRLVPQSLKTHKQTKKTQTNNTVSGGGGSPAVTRTAAASVVTSPPCRVSVDGQDNSRDVPGPTGDARPLTFVPLAVNLRDHVTPEGA